MIQFALVIIVYFLLVNNFFDKSIRPMGQKLQRDMIYLPKDLVKIWLLIAAVLFPMGAFNRARESDWEFRSSLPALANLLGVILGMITNLH